MDIPQIAQFAAALILVLALIILIAWALKRFFGGGAAAGQQALRRRDRRLGLVETLPIGNRHRLVLLRRDDVEHLVLIGGNTELVVEGTISYLDSETDVGVRSVEPSFGTSDDLRAPLDPEPEERREPQTLRDFGRGLSANRDLDDRNADDRGVGEDEPENRFQSAFATSPAPAHSDTRLRADDDQSYADDERGDYQSEDRPGSAYLRAPASYERGGLYTSDDDESDDYRREQDVAFSDSTPREGYEDEDARYPGERYPDDDPRDDDAERGGSRILSRFLKKDGD